MAQVMTRGMVKSKLIIYVMATKAFHKNLSSFRANSNEYR